MMAVFGSEYSSTYDLTYSEKDYGSEVALIEAIFKRYGNGDIHKLLDLGAGTGGHAIPLAQLGYSVRAVDRSEDMVEWGRAKAHDRYPSLLLWAARSARSPRVRAVPGGGVPVGDRLSRKGLYLPSGLNLSESDIERVVDSVKEALRYE